MSRDRKAAKGAPYQGAHRGGPQSPPPRRAPSRMTPSTSHRAGPSLSQSPGTALQQILPDDIIILLIGHGGSGRSTFINDLLPEGAEKMEVSSKLGACTKEVAHTVIDSTSFSDATRRVCSRNFRLVLVDTPGLDVEGQADSAVFQKLSEWSKKWIPESGCKSGVVVLHEVGASRAMDAHDIATLAKSFEIMVGTTKWKYLGGRNGDTHQDQLVKLWAGSLERRQFCMLKQGTHPWTLINTLLPRIEARNKIDFWKTFDAMLPERRKIEVDHDAKREVVKQEVKESLGRMFANAIRRMFGRPPKGKRKDKGQGH